MALFMLNRIYPSVRRARGRDGRSVLRLLYVPIASVGNFYLHVAISSYFFGVFLIFIILSVASLYFESC